MKSQHSPRARLLSEPTAQSPYVPEMVVRNQRLSPCRGRVLNLSGGRRQPPRSTPDEKNGDVFYIVSPAPQEPMARLRVVQCAYSSDI